MRHQGLGLIVAAVGSALAAGAVLLETQVRLRQHPVEGRELPWQAGVRGLGLSYALSPAWTFHAYDPRLAPFAETEHAPLPGGRPPDPHAGAVLYALPPLPGPAHRSTEAIR